MDRKDDPAGFMWALLLHLGYRMWGDAKKNEPLPDRLFCDDATWRAVIDRMAEAHLNTVVIDVGEGVVLPSHPELAVKGSWTPEKMRKEIARMKDLGIEAIPKLNFATVHDAWLGEYQYMVSTPKYYKVCADVIRDVCALPPDRLAATAEGVPDDHVVADNPGKSRFHPPCHRSRRPVHADLRKGKPTW